MLRDMKRKTDGIPCRGITVMLKFHLGKGAVVLENGGSYSPGCWTYSSIEKVGEVDYKLVLPECLRDYINERVPAHLRRFYQTLDYESVMDHEYLELPWMPEDPYVEAALQAPPSPDYVSGPEEVRGWHHFAIALMFQARAC
ncbi:hypothetical protein Tco_0153361 [Tanacetum coccineum]